VRMTMLKVKEEVARIEGYDRIPSVLPTPPSGRGLTSAQQGRRRVGNALAAAGYVETPSFPFTTDEQNDLHGEIYIVPTEGFDPAKEITSADDYSGGRRPVAEDMPVRPR